MKTFALIALLVCASVLTKAEDEYEKGVLVLTKDNFSDTIKNNAKVLVEFYAPWCGHCKKLEPEYSKAALALKKDNVDVILAKIDADSEKEIAQEYGVKGFPTLKWFVDGEAKEYKGERQEEGIVRWIKKRTGPPSTKVSSEEEYNTHAAGASAVLVSVGQDASSELFKAFLSVAEDVETVTFIDSATPVGGVESGVAMVRKGEEPVVYTGEHTSSSLSKWVATESLPFVVPFGAGTQSQIFGSHITKQVILFHDPSKDDQDVARKATLSVSKAHRGSIIFVTMDVVENKNVLEFFGVESSEAPTVFAVEVPAGGSLKKYKFDRSKVDEESLAAFTTDFVDGKLKVHIKSESEPEQTGSVHVLVGSTFQRDVYDSGKDVLVEFYAPWCGHCKKLEPHYNKLAEDLKSIDTVRIAKMDATANDAPEELTVRGFPTLYFFPAGGQPVQFEGDRTTKAMRKFIKKHATHKFKLPSKKTQKVADL